MTTHATDHATNYVILTCACCAVPRRATPTILNAAATALIHPHQLRRKWTELRPEEQKRILEAYGNIHFRIGMSTAHADTSMCVYRHLYNIESYVMGTSMLSCLAIARHSFIGHEIPYSQQRAHLAKEAAEAAEAAESAIAKELDDASPSSAS